MIKKIVWILTVAGTVAGAQQPEVAATTAPVLSDEGAALLNRPVTVRLQAVSVHRAIDAIAAAAKVRIAYQPELLDASDKTVNLTFAKITLQSAVGQVLAGTNLRMIVVPQSKLVVVEQTADSVMREPVGTVIGTVVDSVTGAALGKAVLTVDGTKSTSVTNAEGQFVLRGVPAGDRMVTVRHIGYTPQSKPVHLGSGDRTRLRFVLASSVTMLSGIVTTATGAQRRVELGNDITTLNVDSIMRTAPIMSVTDLLETRVPGLTVMRSSGTPGDPARIRLRGSGSITGNNDPIVIVDGVRAYAAQSDSRNANQAASAISVVGDQVATYAAPSPLDQMDPNSIETIDVFKGPSASSMYGSDAANGVIVITTKRGRTGPAHWSAALNQGTSSIPGKWPMNYYRFGSGYTVRPTTLFCAWNDLSCSVDSIVGFQALNDPRYTVFGRGSIQDVSTTVSGGSGPLTYALSGSGARNQGLFKLPGIEVNRVTKFTGAAPPRWMRRPDNYNSWGVNGSLVAAPRPAMQVALSSSLFNSTQQRSSLNGAISQLQGVYIDPRQLGSTPLINDFVERATSTSLTANNAITGNWQALSWLPLSATVGLNTIQRTDESLIPYGKFGLNREARNRNDTTGHYGLGRATTQMKTVTMGANNVSVLAGHVVLAVGGTVTQQSTADLQASTSQLEPGVNRPTTFPTSPIGASAFGQAASEASTYGWYVEPRFNVGERLFIAPGFRLDGGSASGSNAGLTGFPKMDFSYLAVDQARPWGALTLFRPRLAIGYAGTQPGPIDRLRLMRPGFGGDPLVTLNGTTFVPATALSSLGNSQLRPERSRELEWGGDVDLWNGRLSLMYTRYTKVRNDAIVNIPVAPSVLGGANYGGGSQFRNIGVIRNTGTELSVSAQMLERRAVSWNVVVSMSQNANRVVRLNRDQSPIDLGDGTRIVVGYPLAGRWTRPIVAYGDANDNGVIEANEIRIGDTLVYAGQQEPKYNLNLSSGMTLLDGQLSLNATVAYQNGVTQFNLGGMQSGAFAMLPNAPGTSLGTQAAVIAASAPASQGSISNSGVSYAGLIQTVSTLRFNSVSIRYTMPHTLARWFHVPRASVALQGSNLGLYSNYRGMDPNVNAFANSNANQTTDSGQLPQPRTWRVGVTLGN